MPPGPNRDSQWNILMSQGHIDPQAPIEKYDPGNVEFELDHKQDISIHWNIIGFNDDDNERIRHTMDKRDWEVKTLKSNQGKKKEKYIDYVGPNFKSIKVENGGKTIGGQPFLKSQNCDPLT